MNLAQGKVKTSRLCNNLYSLEKTTKPSVLSQCKETNPGSGGYKLHSKSFSFCELCFLDNILLIKITVIFNEQLRD